VGEYMKRKFKPKKNKKKHFFSKLIILFVSLYLMYQLVSYLIINVKLVSGNEEFLKAIINDSNHYLLYSKKANNTIDKIIKIFTKIDFKNPTTILSQTFKSGNKIQNSGGSDNIEEVIDNLNNYVEDPSSKKVDNPRVYIYNTHQGETYNNKNLEAYNITPSVMMASYLLKEKLNNLNIPTVAEEGNILEFIRINNWQHQDSYKASRFFIIDAFNKYSNLDLIIDIHRDALTKSASTITIDGKNYAKVLFVVGLDHDNYQANLDLSNKLSTLINSSYSNLSRGVIEKSGEGVDGIYNQDLSQKMVLIEIGGQENTIDEVLNTVDALSLVIKNYLGV